MMTTPRSKPVREPTEVFLVDCIEHLHQRSLDDFVFQRSDSKRALPPIRFRDVLAPRWQCSICAPMNAGMQPSDVGFEVLRVLLPRDPVHSRSRTPLEPEVGIRE